VSVTDPSLSNRDLAPTTPAQRTWGFYNYTALWFSICMEITTYQLASSLIAKSINPRAIAALVLGVTIALIGLFVEPLHFLYDYAWFVGFFTVGIVYVALMKLAAPASYPEGAEEAA
jgi:cytosine/uracil/thiamine/allantoin permease